MCRKDFSIHACTGLLDKLSDAITYHIGKIGVGADRRGINKSLDIRAKSSSKRMLIYSVHKEETNLGVIL